MEGLVVINEKGGIAQISMPNSQLKLLNSYSNVDIMIQVIGPGAPTWITPSDDKELIEYFYIIEGSLILIADDAEYSLDADDCFYVSGIINPITVKSKNGVKLLYVTSKPTFNYLYSYIGDLNELLIRTGNKDKYTYDHGKRVMGYSIAIAEQLGFDKVQKENITVAALFHDIGKCNMPDEILNKPGQLTQDQFRYIMRHPIHSRILIENKLGKDVAEIAEQHHEKIDGTGYPYGLTDEEIRIEAKIIAVADVFDAMTTDRPYKKAVSCQEAIEEIIEFAGIQYDKKIVDALYKVIKDKNM